MFRQDRDQDIALTVWNLFASVRDRWPDAWKNVEKGNILNRTTGFAALMRFLRPAYNAHERPGEVPPVAHFSGLLRGVALGNADFTPDQFKPGGTGEAALASQLIKQAGL